MSSCIDYILLLYLKLRVDQLDRVTHDNFQINTIWILPCILSLQVETQAKSIWGLNIQRTRRQTNYWVRPGGLQRGIFVQRERVGVTWRLGTLEDGIGLYLNVNWSDLILLNRDEMWGSTSSNCFIIALVAQKWEFFRNPKGSSTILLKS